MSTFCFYPIKPADYTEALNLFWTELMPHEQTTRLSKSYNGTKIANLDLIMRQLLQLNVSYMAKTNSGEIAGVIFCAIDKIDTFPDKLPCKSFYLRTGWPERFINVLLLLDQAIDHKQFMKNKKVKQKFDLFAVVVKKKYQRQGLATQLILKAIQEAKNMNFNMITMISTSKFTQQICIKLGFNIENTIFYKDWYCDHIKVCNDDEIDPIHQSMIVYFKCVCIHCIYCK
jgi:predicted GNAT family acetyltransferase